MRITTKQLEERIKTINYFLKTDITLYKTKCCGVDLRIEGEYVSKQFNDKLLTNKQAMEYLDKKYNQKIRELIIKMK